MAEQLTRMKHLIDKLNRASHIYYNTDNTIMSDEEYDILFAELKDLEKKQRYSIIELPVN